MIQEIGHNIIYPSDTSHERNSRGDFTIPLEFSSFRKRFAKFPLRSLEEMTLHVKSVPPRHGRENNDCQTDDPLERVSGIVVARACRVCVTLGRSTTPPCFLLEYIPLLASIATAPDAYERETNASTRDV